jgi:quercetin dioxygenase-like cupin family protein
MQYGEATIVDNLRALELQPPGAAAAAVYDRPIGLRQLYADASSGAEHYLVRYPPGLKGRLHRHTAAHTMIILEGRLMANGQIIGPGAYAHFPAGEPMLHEAADNAACLFVLLFDGPFDVCTLD